MMFNNKFNSDGTIHFDVNEWTNTDPDEYQFCRKINDTTFEYIQIKDCNWKNHIESLVEVGKPIKSILALLSDKTVVKDWYQDEIDVNDYDADELGEYLSPYGGILDNVADVQTKNQLTAECIFETDLTCGDYD